MLADAAWRTQEIAPSLPLTLALPKGRLLDRLAEYLEAGGFSAPFEGRKLVAEEKAGRLRIIQVKNSDLPVYVHHGIAGLGICGKDVIYESGHDFFRLLRLPFGSTRMCLAGRSDQPDMSPGGHLRVATKFVRFTRDHFLAQGIPIEIISLDGSVELAPVLGLAPYIVDLVETGSTLEANNLSIIEELERVDVYLVANPAYYKLHYRAVDLFVDTLFRGTEGALKL